MKTYKANFNANNGTRFMKPIEDTNLSRIIKSVRETAEGNRFANSECSWTVWVDSDDGRSEVVAAGGMRSTGSRYRITDKYALRNM